MDVTQVSEWVQGTSRPIQDYLAAEEPLEIRLGADALTVTMRTPGHDLELAAGFLFTEGLIHSRDDLAALHHDEACKPTERGNRVCATLRSGLEPDIENTRRGFLASAACGICGKASIDSVRKTGIRRPNPAFRVEADLLCTLPNVLLTAQEVFSHTGGLHAAGLFDAAGTMLVHREDVGRHNAVDKVVGWALLNDLVPLSESIMLVSGRGGFEIIQKAAAAGVPVLASVSAPSGLAVQLAREVDLTLVGFLRGQRFICYSGESRLRPKTAAGEGS
jgi:FdhD protein